MGSVLRKQTCQVRVRLKVSLTKPNSPRSVRESARSRVRLSKSRLRVIHSLTIVVENKKNEGSERSSNCRSSIIAVYIIALLSRLGIIDQRIRSELPPQPLD